MKNIFIVDTTLRDGEQTPGIAFSKAEKLAIAKGLDDLGVPYIEAGIPVMGGGEAEAIREMIQLGLKAKIVTWNRINLRDIKASLACGARYLHLSAPVSDLHIRDKLQKNHQWVLDNLKEAITYAKGFGCDVSVGAEDASRADEVFLRGIIQLAKEEGASRIRFADTIGILDPFQTYDWIKKLTTYQLPIEIHAHNDFGMALANSLAALRAGATYVSTTVTGIGERAGNCSLEDLNFALESLYKVDLGFRSDRMRNLSGKVALLTGRSSQHWNWAENVHKNFSLCSQDGHKLCVY